MTGLELLEIQYPSPLEDVDPENGNIDVHVLLRDGRLYSFVIGTPNNIFWCMDNEGIDYFFGTPFLFVRVLDQAHVEKAIRALLSENDGKWLDVYGVLQNEERQEI